jgi:lysophospholipase L1-like esterase
MKKTIIFLAIIIVVCAFRSDRRPVHIFMIGDSTMADKKPKEFPEMGWGQALGDFFSDSVVVANHAVNGRSSLSFLNEGRWETVVSRIQLGDYVIIQFGHNDKKADKKRYTEPFGSYQDILSKYIDETRAKGGIPILCTSIVRRHFNEDGTLIDTHGPYLEAVKELAQKKDVCFVDMENKTKMLVESMGPEASKQLFMFIGPGIYPTRPKGVKDSTHLSQLGAYTVASLAVEGMKGLNLPLCKYLK